MKIAIYYPRNMYASWYTLGGYTNTLIRMGHEVIDCPFPGNLVQNVEKVKAMMPKFEDLLKLDLILLTFAEYTQPWISQVYGWESWRKLMEKVPVIARFDESFDREDLGLPWRWDCSDTNFRLKDWAHRFSFPAAQDARRFEGTWHPFGVDHTVFNQNGITGAPLKKWEVAFIGSMYPSRQGYLKSLFSQPSSFTFTLGQVVVQDLGGIRLRESTDLLAENYRQIKIFFCLPPMSRLVVCKVWEIMGCGTMVMYPRLRGEAEENLELFKDREHIVYYNSGYIAENLRQIDYYLKNEAERERIAANGHDLVHSTYRLDQLMETLLAMKEGVIQPESEAVSQ